MQMQTRITEKLQAELHPTHLEVVNESHMHNVPANSESHFKVTIVSAQFEGKMLIARHRLINKVLASELDGGIHALALHTLTATEWQKKAGQVTDSPPCHGGSK
ncbi:MAG: BolA/IbaG family iron-sulfur metabolism protein [Gammaproteobacteria bacterium]|nr:BolA/IbaG family iron-sulfur metabolism protein [Gammaproteobacteria bacterium]